MLKGMATRLGVDAERCRAFGDQIRRLRKMQRLSQEALAHQAGLDRTYVGGIERGARNVALLNIWRLADALGVAPAEFFEVSDNGVKTSS